jgi:hypothetical protein
MENIDDLDEAKILGYFETVRSTFLLKIAFLVSITTTEGGKRRLLLNASLDQSIHEVCTQLSDPLLLKAVKNGNEELLFNLQEDAVTGLVMGSWIVFEQIIKDLRSMNYAHLKDELNADYAANIFGFDKREKRDLELFYYLRNTIAHSNGAFTGVKSICHTYDGHTFDSSGMEGVKMELTIPTAWRIAGELERCACKAWSNVKASLIAP